MPPDAFDGIEVGVAEVVVAAHGGVAGTRCDIRPKVAGGINIADGLGVGQDGVKLHRLVLPDGLQRKMADLEIQWNFAGLLFSSTSVALSIWIFADKDFYPASAAIFSA